MGTIMSGALKLRLSDDRIVFKSPIICHSSVTKGFFFQLFVEVCETHEIQNVHAVTLLQIH